MSVVRQDDPLCKYVPAHMRTTVIDPDFDTPIVQQPPVPDDDASKPDELDLESFLLVTGILQLQLLQLPIQPRRFSEWTVAPRTFGL